MNNIIKAIFIEMFEQVGAEYNEEILSILVEAYYNADKDVNAIKIAKHGAYELENMIFINADMYRDLSKINNVFEAKKESCDEFDVDFLVLERFFASLHYSIIKSI